MPKKHRDQQQTTQVNITGTMVTSCRQNPPTLEQNMLVKIEFEQNVPQNNNSRRTKNTITKKFNSKKNSQAVTYGTIADPTREEKNWQQLFNETTGHVNTEFSKSLDQACETKYPGTSWNKEPVLVVENMKKNIKNTQQYLSGESWRGYLCKENQQEVTQVNPLGSGTTKIGCINTKNRFSVLAKLTQEEEEKVVPTQNHDQTVKIKIPTVQGIISCPPNEVTENVITTLDPSNIKDEIAYTTEDCVTKNMNVNNDTNTQTITFCNKADTNRNKEVWDTVFKQSEEHFSEVSGKFFDKLCSTKYPRTFWNKEIPSEWKEIKEEINRKHNSINTYERSGCNSRGVYWVVSSSRETFQINCISNTTSTSNSNLNNALGVGAFAALLTGYGLYKLYEYFAGENETQQSENTIDRKPKP